MIRPTRLIVDLDRIVENAKFLRQITANEFFCPMVKADAYGHGAEPVCRALCDIGVQQFGVALFEEGIELRKQGLDKPQILVFAPLSPAAVEAAETYNLTPVIVRKADVSLLQDRARSSMPVHLKIQTGMQRLGVAPQDALASAVALRAVKGVRLEGLCTHLANAEDVLHKESQTETALQVFDQTAQQIGSVDFLHVFNSASLVLLHQLHSNWLGKFGSRPGIALYGGWPSESLGEALRLQTQVIQVHEVARGDGVSYGHTWKADRNSLIGVLPVGYADGIRRSLSGRLTVQVHGKRVKCVGRVCMDYIMVDLTDLGLGVEKLLNSEVTVLDGGAEDMSSSAWANKLDTIPYEVMTSFSKRLPREYL